MVFRMKMKMNGRISKGKEIMTMIKVTMIKMRKKRKQQNSVQKSKSE